MAEIEIWSRDVEKISDISWLEDPQHMYFIKTNDDGTKEILRGGPDTNMIAGDLVVVKQSYDDERQSDGSYTYDWNDGIKTRHYIKKIFFLILILFVNIECFQQHAEANMVNKFKKGFYFEKYKTAEEAKAALLKLHPIGTNVDDLVKTLEKAGAKEYNPYSYYENSNFSGKKYEKPNNLICFRYKHDTLGSLWRKQWHLGIKFKNKKTESLIIQIYQGE